MTVYVIIEHLRPDACKLIGVFTNTELVCDYIKGDHGLERRVYEVVLNEPVREPN